LRKYTAREGNEAAVQAVQRRIELRRKTLPVLPESEVDTVMCMPCCLQHFAARTDHARVHGMQAASAHAWLLQFGARSQPLYAQVAAYFSCASSSLQQARGPLESSAWTAWPPAASSACTLSNPSAWTNQTGCGSVAEDDIVCARLGVQFALQKQSATNCRLDLP